MECADFKTGAKQCFGGGELEIRNYTWAEPVEHVYCDPYPSMALMIKPPPTPTKIRIKRGQQYSDELTAGGIVFRPANLTLHCMNPGGSFRVLACQFDLEEVFRRIGEEFRELAEAPPDVDIHNGRIASALHRVLIEIKAPSFGSNVLVEALMTTVLVELMRFDRVTHEQGSVLASWQLRRIDEMLHDYNGLPTVTMIADELGMSGRHLNRLFSAATGVTLSRHIARNQFNSACALLGSTEMPLKQIAYKVGFSSHSSFSAAFVREAGMSPSEFRRAQRGISSIPGRDAPVCHH